MNGTNRMTEECVNSAAININQLFFPYTILYETAYRSIDVAIICLNACTDWINKGLQKAKIIKVRAI